MSFSVWEAPVPGSAFQMVVEAVATHGNPNVKLPDVDGKPPLPFFHFASPEVLRAESIGMEATV